jgi:predicted small metal-binding protein
MNIDKAKKILKDAGRSLVSEENVQLSDKFRTAWNSLMSAMSDFTNWNRVVMWYARDKYERKATFMSEAYARGQCSLHEIIEKMKSAGSEWYRDLLSEINAILKKNHLEVTGDRGEFTYEDKSYKILPVCNSVGSKCSFEIRENSDEDVVFKRTPFIENPDEALDALETLIEENFNTELGEAKEILKNTGFLVEYIERAPGPSTFGKYEYTVDYNWWPSDKTDYWVNRQDTVWLENPDDEDEIIDALSDILGEGSPEVEILSVN